MKMLAAAPTVLLVEPDDYRLRRHTLELLHDTEFHLIAAVNSRRTAVPVIQREKIDLAVVNVRLPDGSGAEITREILRRNPQAHVLIATDVSEENTVMQAVEAGADGYLLFDDNTPSIAASLKVMQSGGSPVSPLIARSVLRALHNRNAKRQGDFFRGGNSTSCSFLRRALRLPRSAKCSPSVNTPSRRTLRNFIKSSTCIPAAKPCTKPGNSISFVDGNGSRYDYAFCRRQ